MTNPMSPIPFGAAARSTPRRADTVSFADRLGLICELMSMLEVVTRAGQDHVMHRVLGMLRFEVDRGGIPLTRPENMLLVRALKELEHEAARFSPNPSVFNSRARFAVDVLQEVESVRPPQGRHG